jgi:thioredoxin 1
LSTQIIDVTDERFEQDVLHSKLPVLVDFWAEWCGPCQSISELLKDLAEQFKGQISIAKLNIDDNPNTPPKYHIRAVPPFVLFLNCEVEAIKVGPVTKEKLIEFIENNLAFT